MLWTGMHSGLSLHVIQYTSCSYPRHQAQSSSSVSLASFVYNSYRGQARQSNNTRVRPLIEAMSQNGRPSEEKIMALADTNSHMPMIDCRIPRSGMRRDLESDARGWKVCAPFLCVQGQCDFFQAAERVLACLSTNQRSLYLGWNL